MASVRSRLAVGALTFGLVLVGCSSSSNSATTSDGGTPTSGDTSASGTDSGGTNTGGTGTGDTGTGTNGTCDSPSLTGVVKGKPFTASGYAAVSLEGGRAYTMYVTDFPITTDDLSRYRNPEVPDGKTMFMIADTVLNAKDGEEIEVVAPGDEVEWQSEFGVRTFTMVATSGGEQYGNNAGAKGTLTVSAVGDRFCGTIDYADDEKTIAGTFAADVKPL